MENTSNTLYRDLYSNRAMLNNNVSCRNLADNNSLMDANCDNLLSQDTTPVIIAIVITALYSIVCVVGLVGNVLVMYVIIR